MTQDFVTGNQNTDTKHTKIFLVLHTVSSSTEKAVIWIKKLSCSMQDKPGTYFIKTFSIPVSSDDKSWLYEIWEQRTHYSNCH